MLIGLSILVFSFAFLSYQIPFTMWPRLLDFWREKESTSERLQAEDEDHDSGRDETNTAIMPPVSKDTGPDRPYDTSQSPEDESDQTTPRARADPAAGNGSIPVLSLAQQPGTLSEEQKSSPESPSQGQLIQLNLLSTTSPKPSPKKQIDHLAMPPPPRPSRQSLLLVPVQQTSLLKPLSKTPSLLNPPPSYASNLRAPSSLALPKTSSSQQQLTTSILPSSARNSKKVILAPGHSALDWAHLTKHPPTPTFLRGANVPPNYIRVTPSLLKQHNGRKGRDAWSTWQGKVYNVTPYLGFHPGGEGQLLRGAGKVGEAEKLFKEVHAWVNWEGILAECLVGVMVSEGAGTEVEGDLDEMD